MPITLLPSLIIFSISKVVAPVASRIDPRYLNLLTALICPVSATHLKLIASFNSLRIRPWFKLLDVL
jgi:hypothetical protein